MNARVKGVLMVAGGIATGAAVFKPVLNLLGYNSSKRIKDNPVQDVTPIDTENLEEPNN